MTKGYSILLLMAALTALTGCMADDESLQTGQAPVELMTSVVQMATEAPTRAAATLQETQLEAETSFQVTFGSGTTLVEGTTVTYTTTDALGHTECTGTVPYFALGTAQVTAHGYYPSKPTSGTFSVQTDQSTDAGYKASDLMYGTATINKGRAGTLTFDHKMAKIVVNATLGAGIGSITGVELVGGYRTVNVTNATSCTLGTTLSDAISAQSPVTVWTGTHTTGTLTCAALLPPQTVGSALSPANFLQVETDKGPVTFSLAGKTFESGNLYIYDANISLAGIGTVTAITAWGDQDVVNITVDSGDNAPAGVEAVDLGLPSGTLWANMNVGATAVTGYGTYFAWGETSGYTVVGATTTAASGNVKTVFDWNTYAWCTTDESNMTKYSTSSSFWLNGLNGGTPDGVTQLELGDDAAHANWGGDWVMPTYAEINELIAGTDYEWTTVGGVAGGKFMKKSDHSIFIFLPAAGCRYDTDVDEQGSSGYYWSSALYEDDLSLAWSLLFYDDDADVFNFSFRSDGYPVRPVIPAKQPELGDAYYSDGSWGSNPHASDATVIGVVAWLGSDSDLKCSRPHGLVMALNDVSSTQTWGPTSTDETFLTNTSSIDGCQSNNKKGSTNTANLLDDGHKHKAASAARNYTPAAPSTTVNSNWFLPSAAQWLAVTGSSGIGGYTGTFVWAGYASSSTNILTNINNRLTASGVGGTGLTTGANYWSSTETTSDGAVSVYFLSEPGVGVSSDNKANARRVRAFLAF